MKDWPITVERVPGDAGAYIVDHAEDPPKTIHITDPEAREMRDQLIHMFPAPRAPQERTEPGLLSERVGRWEARLDRHEGSTTEHIWQFREDLRRLEARLEEAFVRHTELQHQIETVSKQNDWIRERVSEEMDEKLAEYSKQDSTKGEESSKEGEGTNRDGRI